MRSVLPLAPANLVDLLLNLQGLEVVELGLVALELGEELVLAALLLCVVSNLLSFVEIEMEVDEHTTRQGRAAQKTVLI